MCEVLRRVLLDLEGCNEEDAAFYLQVDNCCENKYRVLFRFLAHLVRQLLPDWESLFEAIRSAFTDVLQKPEIIRRTVLDLFDFTSITILTSTLISIIKNHMLSNYLQTMKTVKLIFLITRVGVQVRTGLLDVLIQILCLQKLATSTKKKWGGSITHGQKKKPKLGKLTIGEKIAGERNELQKYNAALKRTSNFIFPDGSENQPYESDAEEGCINLHYLHNLETQQIPEILWFTENASSFCCSSTLFHRITGVIAETKM